MIKPRPYQVKAIHDIRAAFSAGAKRTVFVLPTGGGKTCVASMIGAGLHKKGKSALYLGHRAEIVRQLGDALRVVGVPHAYIVAGSKGLPRAPVYVASIATLHRRLDGLSRRIRPDLIFVDESHHSRAKTWQDVIEAFPEAKVVGLTATPCRLDGKGLGELFDNMVLGPDTSELIKAGFLSDYEVYAPPAPDLRGVHKVGGDYNLGELDKAMRKAKITGDAVKHYRKLAHGKSAVVFCTSVAHAEEVAQKFRDAGYNFKSIDGKMDADERRALIDDMTAGRITGLTSCDIISEGTDIPRIECVILLRPTASLGLHRQQVGRGLRLFPGKERLIILDHAGNTMAHGLPDDAIEWSLTSGVGGSGERKDVGPKLRNCPSCLAIHKSAPTCPRCGHVYEVKARRIDYEDGELQKVERGVAGTGKPDEYWQAARRKLEQIQRERGYKPGWADYILRSRQAKAREQMAQQLAGAGVRVGRAGAAT